VTAVQGFQFVFVVGLGALLLPGMGITAIGVTWTACQFLLAAVMLATILRPVLLSGDADGTAPAGTD
jgi:hypothetical protein